MDRMRIVFGIAAILTVAASVLLLTHSFPSALGSSIIPQEANRTFFATSFYANASVYTILLLGNPPSSDIHVSLNDYNLTYKKLADGSLLVKILRVSTNSTEMLALKPGYKLYHIELAPADDLYNEETTLTDDKFITVDEYGYIDGIYI